MDIENKFILIKGDASKWYDHILFIPKSSTPANKIPVDFVAEAEKIVNSYLSKNNLSTYSTGEIKKNLHSPKKTSRKSYDTVVNVMMLTCCLILAGILLYAIR